MPLDSTNKVVSGLRKTSGANTSLNKDYTKSSFLLLKDSAGYQAYIMVIIADAGYIKNDPTKLSRNSYAKRDSDFSGNVLYFTPKGAHVNGYTYKNGALVTAANQSSGGQAVQSTGAVKVNTAEICTDWFIDVYEDDVLVYTEYIGTSCYSTGGNDGGGGGGSPPPTPCKPPTNPPPPTTPPVNVESIISGGTLKGTSVEPGGDGGYEPPAPCPVVDPPIEIALDSIKNTCIKSMVNSVISATNIKSTINNDIQGIYANVTAPPHLIILDVTNLPNSRDGQTDSYYGASGALLYSVISLNQNILKNSSQEYIAATILHEAAHAVLNATPAGTKFN